jgi:predicted PurR-regulated permease PerM
MAVLLARWAIGGNCDMRREPLPAARPRASDDDATSRSAPPLPRDGRSVLIACILGLMVFYTLYFTAEIVVPLIFAGLLKLLLTPGYRALTRWHVPGPLAALTMMVLLVGIVGTFGYGLAAPASDWIGKAPQSLPRIEQQLSVLRQPIDRLLNLTHKVEQMAEPSGGNGKAQPTPAPAAAPGSTLAAYLFSGTRSLVAGIGITALLLFFLLVSGDVFLRKLVEILPTFSDKKQAVEMSQEIEHNISAYLVTITIMNALVGIATFLAMWAIGLPNPALWGALAFLLNYVLILGPLTGVILFFAVGLLTFSSLWYALVPAAAYLAIHVIEGELVTPMLVARRFTLNPVLVIGALVFWDWMWGIPGALVAVPLLGMTKIVCDRVRPLMAIGHFIGG